MAHEEARIVETRAPLAGNVRFEALRSKDLLSCLLVLCAFPAVEARAGITETSENAFRSMPAPPLAWVLYDDFDDDTLDLARWDASCSGGAALPSEQSGEILFSAPGPIVGEAVCLFHLLAPGLVGVPNPAGIRGLVELSTTTPETDIDFEIDAQDSLGDPIMVYFELDEGQDALNTAFFAAVDDPPGTTVWSVEGPAAPQTWYQLEISIEDDQASFFVDGTPFAVSPVIVGLQPTAFRIGYFASNVGGDALLDDVEVLPEPAGGNMLIVGVAALLLLGRRRESLQAGPRASRRRSPAQV